MLLAGWAWYFNKSANMIHAIGVMQHETAVLQHKTRQLKEAKEQKRERRSKPKLLDYMTKVHPYIPELFDERCGQCREVGQVWLAVPKRARLALWAYREGQKPWENMCGECWEWFLEWLQTQPQTLQETYTGRWCDQPLDRWINQECLDRLSEALRQSARNAPEYEFVHEGPRVYRRRCQADL